MDLKLKTAIQKARARKAGSNGDIRDFIGFTAQQRAEELFNEVLDELKSMTMTELQKVISGVKKGDKGDPGRPGLSIRGLPGRPGLSIRGLQGLPGKQGIPGKSIQGPPGKSAADVKVSDLLKKINASKGGLNIEAVSGLKQALQNLQTSIRRQVGKSGSRAHGGGMSIDAGSNITLTRNSNGRWTITATSGGGSAIATEQVTAVNSGTDVTIDLTQLAHASTGVLFVTRSGQVLLPNGNANLPGSSWSQSGSTVTVYNADQADGYLIQYSHA